MGMILKAVAVLAVLGFLGLTLFAYLGDHAPAGAEIRTPVSLDGTH